MLIVFDKPPYFHEKQKCRENSKEKDGVKEAEVDAKEEEHKEEKEEENVIDDDDGNKVVTPERL